MIYIFESCTLFSKQFTVVPRVIDKKGQKFVITENTQK